MFGKTKPYSGPTLPRTLLDKFDIDTSGRSGRKQHYGRKSLPLSRKDLRKKDRGQKKLQKHDHAQKKQTREPVRVEDSSDSNEDETPERKKRTIPTRPTKANAANVLPAPKPILKHSKNHADSNQDEKPSPGPHVTKKTRERLDADDVEIAALEKKLGLKSKKLPKSFENDGLGDLLEGLDGAESTSEGKGLKRKRETDDDKWLADKRGRRESKRTSKVESRVQNNGTIGGGSLRSADSENIDLNSNDSQIEDDDESGRDNDEDEFVGFESDSPKELTRKENPYVPPPTNGANAPAKYVPPSRRAPLSDDTEPNQRLQRQTQGLLNRLSDSNLLSIVNEVDKLYQANPRQSVTANLVDLLMILVCDGTALNDPFIILHAGFISALYKVLGPDFGAHMLEAIVLKIDHFYSQSIGDANSGKEVVNLISLLAQLFNFQVISSDLVFDYICVFLGSLTELHTELLLRIVRTSGPQLRQDDPSSLKDIVLLLQKTVAATPDDQVSIRTQFMIETINDLKNNRLKTGAAGSAIASEHSSRMRKTLGSLNSRGTIKASEPLRIPLEDVRNVEKRGKWWLVGASWKGNTNAASSTSTSRPEPPPHQPSEAQDPAVSDSDNPIAGTAVDNGIYDLAHQNGMNNPLRRSIFTALITASDYRNAHTRLLKLHLSRAQEREIPRVLLHCAGAEKGYNAYYTLVARQLCSRDRKMRVAFQFTLWDFLKRIGADAATAAADAGYDDEGSEYTSGYTGAVQLHTVVNTAKLYGALLAAGALSILILKPIDAAALALPVRGSRTADGSRGRAGSKASTFLEVLLITLLANAPKSTLKPDRQQRRVADVDLPDEPDAKPTAGKADLASVFRPALGQPMLAAGLRAFIARVVAASDLSSNGKERRRISGACEVVARLLTRASAFNAEAEEGGVDDLAMDDGYEDVDVDVDWN